MIKIDRTCSNSFLGYTIISICLLEGDKKQLGVFFYFTTCTTPFAVDNYVNNFSQPFKMPKVNNSI